MTVASAGTFTFAPTAVMTLFENTIVPFAIGVDVTGTIVALRIAKVGFLPLLLRMTEWAKSGSARRRIVIPRAARNPPRAWTVVARRREITRRLRGAE